MSVVAGTGERELAMQLRLSELVSAISRRFIDLPAADVDRGIEAALSDIVHAIGCERAVIAQFSPDLSAVLITHRFGHLPADHPWAVGKTLTQETAPWLFDEIREGREVVVSPDSLPPEAETERRWFDQLGVNRAAYFPIAAAKDSLACLGVVGAEALDPILRPALRTLAQLFASALDRRRAAARATAKSEIASLIADVSRRFAELPSVDVRAGVEEAITRISEKCGFIRAALREVNEDNETFSVTHRYVLEGEPDVQPFRTPIPLGRYPFVLSQMGRRVPLLLSLETTPKDAVAEREDLERAGNPQVLLIPLLLGERTIGSVTFESRTPHDPDVTAALSVIGELFANALERERTARELEERIRFEEALTDASAELLVSSGAIDAALDRVLSAVGTALTFERIGISELSADRTRFEPRNEWCAPGSRSSRALTARPIDEFGWPFPGVRDGKSFVFGPADVPKDAVHIRELLARHEARIVVLLPLIVASRVIGCIAFRRVKSARRPSEQQMDRLRVVAGVVGSAIARRSADALRSQMETRFGQVVESALDGFALVNESGVVLDFTRRAEQLLGFSKLEACGSVFTEFLFPEEERRRYETLEDVWSAARTRPDARLEVECRHKARGSVPIELSVTTLEGPETTYAVFLRDVTDRKIAEEARKRALDEIAHQKTRIEGERDYLREEIEGSRGGTFVAKSAAMNRVRELIDAVAETSSTVLVVGESGVGKELVARAIHAASRRKDGPLVKVNCASIPTELFESEFFGHVRGAFTGAQKDRVGRFELANGGTLFLDEIGEIPLPLQAKLLRVLQEGQFEKVGDDRTRTVDVRIVAATNRDLAADSAAGKFRKDLYYRLSVFPIDVPPLRERREDIVPLAEHFLRMHRRSAGRGDLSFSAEQKGTLTAYAWPGNVRELGHVIERAVIVSKAGSLELPLAAGPVTPMVQGQLLTDVELRSIERENMLAALERCAFRISGPGGAAELLGMNPSTLRDRMKTFDLKKP